MGVFGLSAAPTQAKLTQLKGESMKIVIGEKSFDVTLDMNTTTVDILNNLPFELEMVQYAGHEYYGTPAFKPVSDRQQTPLLLAGHIYYWDGWNSFVINYKESDISPFQSVHIGEINDKSFIEEIQKAGKKVMVKITK